jgi:imidazolonepropionase-like amidohydrolase
LFDSGLYRCTRAAGGVLISLALAWAHSACAGAPVAFVDVNVLPMDRQAVLQHQTVLVQDSSIVRVGPALEVAIPEGAQRIEGKGTAYLMPGLADMHVHVSKPDDLALYLANGVTTVLHMGGDPIANVGVISGGIEDAAVASPKIFFAFKLHGGGDGLTVSTPELARAAVQLAKANGYDFIKVYNELSPPVFAAIVDEARKQGMAVIGHGVRSVGLPKALFEGQIMVAHAEEFLYTAFEDHEDRSRIKSVVADTFRSGAYVTTTLSANEAITRQWGRPEQVRAFLSDPRAAFMTPNVRADWANGSYALAAKPATARADDVLRFLAEFIKALQVKGVPLLAGTDSPAVPGLYPGYSLHDELHALIKAGLSPYEALSAATRVPGQFIAKTIPAAQHFGTITPGLRADLVLVENDPLASVETLKSPIGVMKAGRWLTRAQLAALIQKNQSKY